VGSIESTARDLWDLYVKEEQGLDWIIRELSTYCVHADLERVELLPIIVEISSTIRDNVAESGRLDDQREH